jgi:hypothetical protein
MNTGILLGRESALHGEMHGHAWRIRVKVWGEHTIWCVNEQMVLTFPIALTQRAAVSSRKRGTAKKRHNNYYIPPTRK